MPDSLVRRVLTGGSLLAGAALASKGGMLLWTLVIARVLGVEDFGRISVALALLAVLQILSDTGISLYLTRTVASEGIRGALPTVRAAWILQLMLIPIVLGVGTLLSLFTNLASSGVLGPLTLGVCLAGPLQVTRGLLRGQQYFAWDGLIQVAPVLFMLVGTLVLGDTLTAESALWVFVCAQIPSALLYSGAMGVRAGATKRELRVTPWGLFMATWRFNVFGSLASMFNRLDVLILGSVALLVDVAHYALAAQLFYGVSALCGAVALVILPGFVSDLKTLDRQTLRSRYRSLLLLFTVLGMLAAMSVIGVAPWMDDLLGNEYAGTAPLIAVMGLGLVLVVPGYVPGQVLIALGQPTVLMRSFGAAIVAGVVVFPLSYYSVGTMGVALTMVAIWAAMSLYQHSVVRGLL